MSKLNCIIVEVHPEGINCRQLERLSEDEFQSILNISTK